MAFVSQAFSARRAAASMQCAPGTGASPSPKIVADVNGRASAQAAWGLVKSPHWFKGWPEKGAWLAICSTQPKEPPKLPLKPL